jgi:hypothetical protein
MTEGIEQTAGQEPVENTVPVETPQTPVQQSETPTNTNTSVETPKAPEDVSTAPEAIIIDKVKYGDYDVSVNIPPDLVALANEKEIDIKALSEELYSSENFSLSDESLNKLYDAFGKWQVDTYLSGLKASNEVMLSEYKNQQSTKAEAEKQAWDKTIEIMGGEDRWTDLNAFAEANLSEEEIEDFNHVMKNGSIKLQELMIRDLWSKFTDSGAPLAPATNDLDLEEGGSTTKTQDTTGPLSQEDYLKLFVTGEYKKNPELFDKRRQLGIAKGI